MLDNTALDIVAADALKGHHPSSSFSIRNSLVRSLHFHDVILLGFHRDGSQHYHTEIPRIYEQRSNWLDCFFNSYSKMSFLDDWIYSINSRKRPASSRNQEDISFRRYEKITATKEYHGLFFTPIWMLHLYSEYYSGDI